nr:MAG TPA: hypothetical protein [Caudoviricetes sp.]
MVVSVYGEIENHRIIFRQNEKGLWETTVPFLSSGKYLVTLYAVDQAGNTSYYATAIYTVDTEKITATLEIIEYAAQAKERYDARIEVMDYEAQITLFEVETGDE